MDERIGELIDRYEAMGAVTGHSVAWDLRELRAALTAAPPLSAGLDVERLPDGQVLADWIAEDIKADWPAFLFNAPSEHQAQAERGLRRTSEQLADRLYRRLEAWALKP